MTMISFATLRAAGLLALLSLALGATPALAASSKDLDARMSSDGLQKTKVKNIDLAYARPGATLAPYKRVKLDPVEVAFSPSWNPTRTGSSLKLSSQEKENIRKGVAKPLCRFEKNDRCRYRLERGEHTSPFTGLRRQKSREKEAIARHPRSRERGQNRGRAGYGENRQA